MRAHRPYTGLQLQPQLLPLQILLLIKRYAGLAYKVILHEEILIDDINIQGLCLEMFQLHVEQQCFVPYGVHVPSDDLGGLSVIQGVENQQAEGVGGSGHVFSW